MKNIQVFYVILVIFGIIFSVNNSCSAQQYINAYAKVTNVNSVTKVLTLSTSAGECDYTNDTFNVGEQVMIWQVQDDVIGSNTSDTSTFGDLSSISNAGKFEICVITNRTMSGPNVSTLTLDKIDNSYNIGSNSSVQVISVRHFVSYTTTGDLTALAWNGNIGGALIMVVDGTLTLNHNINVDRKGFRGGAPGWNTASGDCNSSEETRYIENNTYYGEKGEGIYRDTNSTFNNRRGKILTGGGGGNYHNAGGGGGGNFSAGGLGGNGWGGGNPSFNGLCTYTSGGIGGIALQGHIAPDRLFLGGGGGGGQGNQSPNQATKGGDGGGAIFIQANTIETACSGGPLVISANGESVNPTSGNDGGGGGGAGGTIVFNVNNWNAISACVLNISANGANGSSVIHTDAHGGGGAGAQGVVVFSTPTIPTNNINTTTLNGAPGQNCNGCTSNTAGSASNIDNQGIFTFWKTPLPVDLLFFRATSVNNEVAYIDWATSMEMNASHFTIYKSTDGVHWKELGQVEAAGNSNQYHSYQLYDNDLLTGKNIYKLKQTDFNGQTVEKGLASIFVISQLKSFEIFPNPNNGNFTVTFSDDVAGAKVEIFNPLGQLVSSFGQKDHSTEVQLPELKGIYLVKIQIGEKITLSKIVNQ